MTRLAILYHGFLLEKKVKACEMEMSWTWARPVKVTMGAVNALSSDTVGSIPTSPPRCLCSPMVRAAGF